MKNEKIKSGQEVLDAFFKDIKEKQGLDSEVVNAVINLYQTKKLTSKNLANSLSTLREKK